MKRIAHYLVSGDINEDMLRDFIFFLRHDVSSNCEILEVGIASNGGAIGIGIAMYELLKATPQIVRTINLSNVDSAAIVVYAAGAERLCVPNAAFYFHSVGKKVDGVKTKADLVNIINEIDFDTSRIVSILNRTTKMPERHWRELMFQGGVVGAQDSLNYGLSTALVQQHGENGTGKCPQQFQKACDSRKTRKAHCKT